MNYIERILEGLNEKQLEAVKSTEGYIRVTAGAGSGKTKTLTHRYAYLVECMGINPSKILCLTFTNKAAQEIRKRISTLVSCGNTNDFVTTYHGFGVKFLRQEIYKLNYSKSFTILDEEDIKSILKEIYEELDLNTTILTYKQAIKQITTFKKQLPIGKYVEYMLPNLSENTKNEFAKIEAVVSLYIKKQLKLMALDFNDLICFTIYILQHFPDVAEHWQNELYYIMVDETQDNNEANWLLTDILSSKHKNIFAVGDPDQAIYEWRGAIPNLFIDFHKTHQPCIDVIMDENYRSTPNILNVANSVIEKNENRIKKNLFTRRNSGTTVVHYHGKDEADECNWICEQIKQLLKNSAKLSDVSILYRASYLSRGIEQALMHDDFKYTIYGGIRFFERKEIKDALSYLRLIAQEDDLSFLRVINTPSRKIGKVFKKNLEEIAEKESTSLYKTLKRHINDKEFNKESVIQFIELIEESKEYAKTSTISDLLEHIMTKSGLKDDIRTDGDEDRLENINELMQSISLYEETHADEDVSLITYLQDIALYTNIDYKEDKVTIKLMTIHQAKGLEFPFVFVIGLSEGIFPNLRTVRERRNNGLEEERRLAYVAFTRAEKALFLTESEGFNLATRSDKYPSRFLLEIEKGLCVIEGNLNESLIEETKYLIAKENGREIISSTVIFEVGDIVFHYILGEGEVIELNDTMQSYIIKFNVGERPIMYGYSGLMLSTDSEKRLKFEKISNELLKVEKIGTVETDNPLIDNKTHILHKFKIGDYCKPINTNSKWRNSNITITGFRENSLGILVDFYADDGSVQSSIDYLFIRDYARI